MWTMCAQLCLEEGRAEGERNLAELQKERSEDPPCASEGLARGMI